MEVTFSTGAFYVFNKFIKPFYYLNMSVPIYYLLLYKCMAWLSFTGNKNNLGFYSWIESRGGLGQFCPYAIKILLPCEGIYRFECGDKGGLFFFGLTSWVMLKETFKYCLDFEACLKWFWWITYILVNAIFLKWSWEVRYMNQNAFS